MPEIRADSSKDSSPKATGTSSGTNDAVIRELVYGKPTENVGPLNTGETASPRTGDQVVRNLVYGPQQEQTIPVYEPGHMEKICIQEDCC